MMSNKGNAEEKLPCPYDKSHHILIHRMQTHLVKCGRNHPNIKIVSCPYNSIHKVQVPELHYHCGVCPDRMGVDKIIYKPENAQGSDVLFPVPKLDVQPTECWDNAPEVATYNPEEHSKTVPILRNNIHTQSAAKRRGFRIEERYRLQQFDGVPSISTNNQVALETSERSRRPIVPSVALQDGHTEICNLREEVAKNADVVIIPKVPFIGQKQINQPHNGTLHDDINNLEENLSSMNIKDQEPTSAVPNPKPITKPNYSAATRGIGRGSFLARK